MRLTDTSRTEWPAHLIRFFTRLRADVRWLRLSKPNDPWYAGSGAFQQKTFGYVGRPSGGKRSLGTVFDVSVDYNLAQRTTLTFYGAGVRSSLQLCQNLKRTFSGTTT